MNTKGDKHSTDTIDGKTQFSPSLWKQRRSFAVDALERLQCASVLDLGCGRGSTIQDLLDLSWVSQIAGIDLSINALLRAKAACEIDRNQARTTRLTPIELNLYQGSLQDVDPRLGNFDALICLEVIEHLDPRLVLALPITIFKVYRPRVVVISTPNAEFNAYFPELKYGTSDQIFRHNDHRFEWTRHEFQNWCQLQAQIYGYSVEFGGVGVLGESNCGFCSQIAIFDRLTLCLNETISDAPHEEGEVEDTADIIVHPYQLVAKITFPIMQEGQATKQSRLVSIRNPKQSAVLNGPAHPFARECKAGAPMNREIPRSYQLKIFEKARESNIIAVIDTGSGKTLIAIMLMRFIKGAGELLDRELMEQRRWNIDTIDSANQNISSSGVALEEGQPLKNYDFDLQSNKCSIFLVPTVPLVNQQGTYICINSDLKTSQIWGNMRSSSSHRKLNGQSWAQEVAETDVIVMTAEIMRMALQNGYLEMKMINLIIFDECHHAVGQHPYTLIMRNFFSKCSLGSRPKIFGMTASPVASGREVLESIEILEANLHCEAVTIHAEEMFGFIVKAKQQVLYYIRSDFYHLPERFIELNDNFPNLCRLVDNKMGINLLSEEWGPWITDRAIEIVVEQISEFLKVRKDSLNFKHLVDDYSHLFDHEIEALQAECIGMQQMNFWGANSTLPLQATLTPKVNTLVELLFQIKSETFRGIIFVKERIAAFLLSMVLKRHPLLPHLKCEAIVGHGHSKNDILGKLLRMSSTKQQQILAKFGTGSLNLIIATQVCEEGIDVSPCNYVIRYDLGDTLISHIQSRGRGRAKDAQFIVLAADSDKHAIDGKIELFNQSEATMKDSIDKMQFDPVAKQSFVVKESGIEITMTNCDWILEEYLSILPKNHGSPHYFCTFEERVCDMGVFVTATLPIVVDDCCRMISGPISQDCILAKSLAIFDLLKLLDNYGELDQLGSARQQGFIVPDYFKVETDSMEKDSSITEYPIGIPKIFQGDYQNDLVYLNIVFLKNSIQTSSSIGFLSFRPPFVPKFDLKISSCDSLATLSTISTPFRITTEELEFVRSFHFHLFSVVCRSELPENRKNWTSLIVPLREEACGELARNYIDWDQLEVEFDSKQPFDHLATMEISELAIIDSYRYKRVFFPSCIRRDQSPLSVPCNPREEFFGTVKNLYESRFELDVDIDITQPIILGTSIGFLATFKSLPKPFYEVSLLPQICFLHPIKRRFLIDGLQMPLILTRIYHNELAMDLKELIGLDLCVDLLTLALTCSSVQMGRHYERFETLGDSFLKVLLSMHSFVIYPQAEEGQLTMLRVSFENNWYFYQQALKLGLGDFILSVPLSRNTWRPPTFPSANSQPISNKTMADVVEGIVGASVYELGLNGGVKAAHILLHASEDNASPMEEFETPEISFDDLQTTWGGYANIWSSYIPCEDLYWLDKQLYQSITHVEGKIGYVFQDKNNLARALTHSSFANMASSFERLEFLGDAVLGYVITEFLFRLDETLDPGELTQARSALVCNQFLGFVSAQLGFPAQMQYKSTKLAQSISSYFHEYAFVMNEAKGGLPWMQISSCPKAVADLVESIIGAVFVDSGFDVPVVWKVVDCMLVQPWWHEISTMLSATKMDAQ